MFNPQTQIHKQHIAANFDRAAKNYYQYASLQKMIGMRLIQLMKTGNLQPNIILDLGCGTGHLTNAISRQFPQATVFAIDFAPNMIRLTHDLSKELSNQYYIQADFDHLPLAKETADIIYSNMAMQWSLDLTATLTAWQQTLKKNGLVFFSTLAKRTFYELQVSNQGLPSNINLNTFLSLNEIKHQLVNTGFQELAIHCEIISFAYRDIYTFLRDIKRIGANYVVNKNLNATTRADFKQLEKNYEQFRNAQGKITASYEVIYGVIKKHV